MFLWETLCEDSATDDHVCSNVTILVSHARFKIKKTASISIGPTAVIPNCLHVTSHRQFFQKTLQSLHSTNKASLLTKGAF
jgi:hypothetical protein